MRFFPAALMLVAVLWGFPAVAAPEDPECSFVVIVHPGNPVSSLSRSELERIFRRTRSSWPSGLPIEPLNLPFGQDARAEFSRVVLRSSDDALVQYWNRRYFHGVFPPLALHSVEGMLAFVAETPAAIGYVPRARVTDRVKIVRIDFDD
jgi:ABC-type phosphate transport system substrate-binding protein